MRKTVLPIILAFLLLAVLANSCKSPSSADQPGPTPLVKSNSESSSSGSTTKASGTDLALRLQGSTEVQELTAIWKDLRHRALSSGKSWQELKSAYQRQDEQLLRKSLGLSPQEEDSLTQRLRKLASSLQSKFPELQSLLEKAKPCVDCGSVQGVGKVNILRKPEGCHWVQYTAALIVCSALGPALY